MAFILVELTDIYWLISHSDQIIEVNTLHPPYIVFSPAFYARGSKERLACLSSSPAQHSLSHFFDTTIYIYMSRASQVDSHFDIEVFS